MRPRKKSIATRSVLVVVACVPPESPALHYRRRTNRARNPRVARSLRSRKVFLQAMGRQWLPFASRRKKRPLPFAEEYPERGLVTMPTRLESQKLGQRRETPRQRTGLPHPAFRRDPQK